MKKISRMLGILFPVIFLPMSVIGFMEGSAPIGLLFFGLTAASGLSLWRRLKKDKPKKEEGEAHGAKKENNGGTFGG